MRPTACRCLLLLALLQSGLVVAETSTPMPTGQKPQATHAFGKRADTARLAGMSGGSDVSEQITLNGTVSDNHSDHVVTGANVIDGNSLNGAAGIPMVIQNSGNGVLIQNATIVNVQFHP